MGHAIYTNCVVPSLGQLIEDLLPVLELTTAIVPQNPAEIPHGNRQGLILIPERALVQPPDGRLLVSNGGACHNIAGNRFREFSSYHLLLLSHLGIPTGRPQH